MIYSVIIVALAIILYLVFKNGTLSQNRRNSSSNNEYFQSVKKLNESIYNENPDEQDIPFIIKKGRSNNKGKQLQKLHDKYFSTPFLQVNNSQSYDTLIENIDESLLLIEPFIKYEIAHWGFFDIKSVPVIEFSLRYLPVFEYCEKLNEVYELILYFQELKYLYEDDAKDALKLCKIIPKLLNFIEVNDGVTTKEIKPNFIENYDIIKTSLYYLVKIGKIKSIKKGNYNKYEINRI